jgi:hypothetical protein
VSPVYPADHAIIRAISRTDRCPVSCCAGCAADRAVNCTVSHDVSAADHAVRRIVSRAAGCTDNGVVSRNISCTVSRVVRCGAGFVSRPSAQLTAA